MSNKGIESVPVEATGAIQGLKSVTTDAGGFDDVSQVITAAEDVDHMMLGANPTGPDIRLILTWGPSPSDLDAQVKFFDSNGNEQCKLYWNNKACGDYATLDVDETNGGNNGPETTTIKEIPDGLTAMY